MAKFSILLVLALQVLALPSLNCMEENNPLLDLAASLLQNLGNSKSNGDNNKIDGLATVGKLVGSLLQGDNAKNLGALFAPPDDNKENSPVDLLAGLSSLGSLLGGQDGKLDPNMIGSMVSMFANQVFAEPKTQNARPKRETPQRPKRTKNTGNELDLDSLLSMASGFLSNKKVANYLPLVMDAISAFSEPKAKERADDHKDHSSFLPPYLEKAHLYWDLFLHSELGKNIWEKSGLKKATKAFVGPDGKISFEIMLKNLENHSFRRHWIKAAAKYLTDLVVHITKPEVYSRYIMTLEYVINSFLDAQGLPRSTHFDVKRPDKSITVLANYMLKQYLDIDTDVSEYVKPAVEYVKETLKMAEKISKSFADRGDYNALADRVTDTLNLEVIEPVLRVYRAYKHSAAAPQCQEHLMCLVNRHPDQNKQGLKGFKAGLTKLSSLAASAALSYQNGKGFWDLYNAIQSDVNCEAKYPADCAAFHEHELKVTTEVYQHSEL